MWYLPPTSHWGDVEKMAFQVPFEDGLNIAQSHGRHAYHKGASAYDIGGGSIDTISATTPPKTSAYMTGSSPTDAQWHHNPVASSPHADVGVAGLPGQSNQSPISEFDVSASYDLANGAPHYGYNNDNHVGGGAYIGAGAVGANTLYSKAVGPYTHPNYYHGNWYTH